MFRDAFRRHRCIIPASGYYEWVAKPDGKQPYFISAADGGVLSFAGLWDRWKNPESGEPVASCTIIVTDANALTRRIHDRMPVLLDKADFAPWLSGAAGAEILKPAGGGSRSHVAGVQARQQDKQRRRRSDEVIRAVGASSVVLSTDLGHNNPLHPDGLLAFYISYTRLVGGGRFLASSLASRASISVHQSRASSRRRASGRRVLPLACPERINSSRRCIEWATLTAEQMVFRRSLYLCQ
jgi:hypothetical protein